MDGKGKRPYRRRIRTNLIIAFVTPVVVIEFVFAYSFYVLAKESLDQEMGRRIVAIAQSAAARIPPEQVLTLRPGDEESRGYRNLIERLSRMAEAHAVARIYVFDGEDRSLADSAGEMAIGARYHKLASDRVELERARGGNPAASTLFRGPGGRLYKSGYAPLSFEGNVVAVVGVDASADFFVTLAGIQRNLILLGAATVLGIVMVSLLFARRIERPIEALVQSARRIGEGDLDRPIEVRGRDEVGFLAGTMEEMRRSIVAQTRSLRMLQRGIAHEVRNPLGGIELFTDLLLEELDQESQKDYVRKIQKEVRSLGRVVNSFLEYTRTIAPEPRAVDPAALLQNAVGLVADEIGRRGIQVRQEVEDGLDSARLDPDLVQAALLNVLTNACQAMPEGGILSLLARREGEELVIEVGDTGPGLAPEALAAVFEPFFTTKEKGSGLGLAFAKKICEAHGGSIRADNRAGGGAVFTLRFPIRGEV